MYAKGYKPAFHHPISPFSMPESTNVHDFDVDVSIQEPLEMFLALLLSSATRIRQELFLAEREFGKN